MMKTFAEYKRDCMLNNLVALVPPRPNVHYVSGGFVITDTNPPPSDDVWFAPAGFRRDKVDEQSRLMMMCMYNAPFIGLDETDEFDGFLISK